jgi:hypothetical protein
VVVDRVAEAAGALRGLEKGRALEARAALDQRRIETRWHYLLLRATTE